MQQKLNHILTPTRFTKDFFTYRVQETERKPTQKRSLMEIKIENYAPKAFSSQLEQRLNKLRLNKRRQLQSPESQNNPQQDEQQQYFNFTNRVPQTPEMIKYTNQLASARSLIIQARKEQNEHLKQRQKTENQFENLTHVPKNSPTHKFNINNPINQQYFYNQHYMLKQKYRTDVDLKSQQQYLGKQESLETDADTRNMARTHNYFTSDISSPRKPNFTVMKRKIIDLSAENLQKQRNQQKEKLMQQLEKRNIQLVKSVEQSYKNLSKYLLEERKTFFEFQNEEGNFKSLENMSNRHALHSDLTMEQQLSKSRTYRKL